MVSILNATRITVDLMGSKEGKIQCQIECAAINKGARDWSSPNSGDRRSSSVSLPKVNARTTIIDGIAEVGSMRISTQYRHARRSRYRHDEVMFAWLSEALYEPYLQSVQYAEDRSIMMSLSRMLYTSSHTGYRCQWRTLISVDNSRRKMWIVVQRTTAHFVIKL